MEGISPDMILSLGATYIPGTNESNTLSTIIQRINFERGGFANITEESLRQEIAEKEAASSNDGESSSDEDDEEDEDPVKKLMTSKMELLGQIDTAHRAAMVSLEFVSLLISKDMPTQGGATLSQYARENIGMGTLGMDKLQAPRTTPAQKLDNQKVAKGWKAQSLSKTVDSILASATRLEKEIELETKYWDQVLSVSDNGWAVCRLPNEKHTLGVRFGFSESSPSFRNRSLGALRRNLDGTVTLDHSISSSQAIRVRVFEVGRETGSTTPPTLVPDNAPIEPLIRQARNTIFDEELWQELNRESRSLGAFSVTTSPTENTITFSLTATKTAVIDLIPLSKFTSPFQTSTPSNDLAEAIHLSIHLSLSWAHRTACRRRTQLPRITTTTNPAKLEPLALLRPLLNRLNHQRTLTSLKNFLQPLASALTSVGLKDVAYTLRTTYVPLPPVLSRAEQTLTHVFSQLESTATLTLPTNAVSAEAASVEEGETTTITITTRTLQNTLISFFAVKLSPESPLLDIAPPPIGAPQFASVREVREWVFWGVGCLLAYNFSGQAGGEGGEGERNGTRSANGNVLRVAEGNSMLSFGVGRVVSGRGREGVKVRVSWEVGAASAKQGKKVNKGYEWVAWAGTKKQVEEWDEGEGVVVKSMGDVVGGVVGR